MTALHNSFDYIDHQGVHCTASLTKVDYNFPKTDDPDWLIDGLLPGQTYKSEWMSYVTHDGGIFQAKVHCEYKNGSDSIATWFEHQTPDGQHNHNEGFMDYVGWDGRHMRASIAVLYRPFNRAPQFEITVRP